MRKSLGLVSALALIGGLAASTSGPHGAGGTGISQMLTPAAEAASVEHQTAINASAGNYAVIAPTFLSGTSTSSYIRLFSGVGAAGSSTTTTFSVTIVGVPSGNRYGATFNVAVPHLASLQFSLYQLVQAAGSTAGAFTNGDTGYAVYLQDPDPESGYQHITYSGSTELLEDMSNCGSLLNEQMSSLHNEMVLTNVQTAKGPSTVGVGIPSTVVIHNYYNVATTYTMSVFNSGAPVFSSSLAFTGVTPDAGRLACQLNITVQANSSQSVPMTEIEGNPSCSGIDSGDWANIVVASQSGGPPNAVLTHLGHVALYGGDTDLTAACAVNSVTSGSSGVTGGGGGGVITSPYL